MNNQKFSLESAPLVFGGDKMSGGFSLNFNLPDVNTVINQAYDFHKSNSVRNFAFLRDTSVMTGQYLNAQIQPVIDATMKQISTNDGNMQNIFNQASDLSYKHLNYSREVTNKSLDYSREISLRSIEAQRAAQSQTAKSGGMCFITTAVCQYFQLADDCEELQTLRRFRDEYMLPNPDLAPFVAEYYSLAPTVDTALANHPDKDAIYANIFYMIKAAVLAAKNSDNELCVSLYCAVIQYALKVVADFQGIQIAGAV